MQFLIAGTNSRVNAVSFFEKGFGSRFGGVKLPYAIVVDGAGFIRSFRPIYDECIRGLIRDDEITGDFHPPYSGAIGYPSIEEFLQLPTPCRMEIIDAYFVFDILRLYVHEPPLSPDVQWLICSMDVVELRGAVLVIEGEVIQD
jgi:hypothetical protein